VRASARAAAIARLTLTKKAYDVAVLDLRGLTTMADFFVVCSADSEPQIKAVADAVEEGMEEGGEVPWHKEAGSPNWVLLDYVDVVLHIFHKEARAFYSLEKLWGDATITAVTDEHPEPDLEARAKQQLEMLEAPKAIGKIRVQKGKAAVMKGVKAGKAGRAGKAGKKKRVKAAPKKAGARSPGKKSTSPRTRRKP
jgi:ribosome-associated protein